jgi:hypothetical protein
MKKGKLMLLSRSNARHRKSVEIRKPKFEER